MSRSRTIAGRYEILHPLGQGGMGEVWAATDLQLGRRVALKTIRSEFRLDPISRVRFLREARALSSLEHASICRIHDYIEGTDQDLLVLELIEGISLKDRMKQGVDRPTAFRIAEQIGSALAAAHAVGLIHRDLKPGNVMFTPQGDAKVLDFGLARSAIETTGPATQPPDESTTGSPGSGGDGYVTHSLTSNSHTVDPAAQETLAASGATPSPRLPDSVTVVGRAVGTPLYMSPEQARGESLGSASDMFSFGLLLHEIFTGRPAYVQSAGEVLGQAIATGRTGSVRGVDRHLAELIARLESPTPSCRPTAVEAVARLRWIRTKPQRQLRRGVAALLVLIALGTAVKYTVDLRRERAAAEFRRSQSDQHIEFMVEELYRRLEPVGRLDILKEVGDTALAYFDTLSEGETTDEDRARLARTLTQIGQVRLTLGDLDSARDAFGRSLAIHADLVDRDSTQDRWQLGLGAAHFGRGSVDWIEEDPAAAAEHFQAYLDIALGLVARDPTNPTNQLELGYALTNMAILHEATGDAALAMAGLERAIDMKQKLVDGEPGNRPYVGSLANTHSWLARVLHDTGRTDEVLPHLHKAVTLRRDLAEDPNDSDAQRNLSTALHDLGDALHRAGQTATAEQLFQEDISISQRLVHLDPANILWRLGLATSWSKLGGLLVEDGRLDEARPLLERSFTETKALFAQGGETAEWREDYFAARWRLAQLEFALGRHSAARRILEDGPPWPKVGERARDLLLAARIAKAQGRHAAAAAAWEQARTLLDSGTIESAELLESVRRESDLYRP